MITVESIEIIDEPCTVYDIEVEHDASFIVSGVVVHNSKVCIAHDGKTYIVGAANIPYPPLHLGCRSSLEPVVDLSALGLPQSKLGERVTYDEWFRKQSEPAQNEIIGRKRAELYRQGKLTLAGMISADNTVLSLEQLQQKMAA